MSGLSPGQFLFSPLSMLSSLEGSTYFSAQHTLKEWGAMLHLLEGECLDDLGFFCTHFSLLPYLLIQSLIYSSMDSGVFAILWVIIQYCFILLLKPFQTPWPLEALSVRSCVPLTFLMVVLFWSTSFDTYKMLQTQLVYSPSQS